MTDTHVVSALKEKRIQVASQIECCVKGGRTTEKQ
jgi:hypothetical protein